MILDRLLTIKGITCDNLYKTVGLKTCLNYSEQNSLFWECYSSSYLSIGIDVICKVLIDRSTSDPQSWFPPLVYII